jgi:hypothetical protein
MEDTSEPHVSKESDSSDNVMEMLRSYLILVGPVLLAPENSSLKDTLASTLLIKEMENILYKFITGNEFPLLNVELMEDNLIMLSLEIRSNDFNRLKSSFILIKLRNMPLEPTRSIAQQLQLVSLLMDQSVASSASDIESSNQARQNTYLSNMQQVTRYLFAPMTKSLGLTEQVRYLDFFVFLPYLSLLLALSSAHFAVLFVSYRKEIPLLLAQLQRMKKMIRFLYFKRNYVN